MIICNNPAGEGLAACLEAQRDYGENGFPYKDIDMHFKGYDAPIPGGYDLYLIHTSDTSLKQLQNLRGKTLGKSKIVLIGGEFTPNLDKKETEQYFSVSDAYFQTQALFKDAEKVLSEI